MAENFIALVRRDHNDEDDFQLNGTMVTMLVILMVLVAITILLIGALFVLRQPRNARKVRQLPMYVEKRLSTSTTHSNHRRVSARPSQSIHIFSDKEFRVEEPSRPSSPTNSLPEIRITFPEEIDASGKRQSGRVVVVHVGDSGVGLGPVDEKLPAYQRTEGERFQSLDLDRIGGLDEKRAPLGWR